MGQNPTDSEVNDMINEVEISIILWKQLQKHTDLRWMLMEVEWLSSMTLSDSPWDCWPDRETLRRRQGKYLGGHNLSFGFLQNISNFRFDTDNTGKVSVGEMKFIMKNLPVKVPEEDVEAMIKEVDEDGNGEIDFEEFKAMIGFWFSQ